MKSAIEASASVVKQPMDIAITQLNNKSFHLKDMFIVVESSSQTTQ
jgi:hypothetical protein